MGWDMSTILEMAEFIRAGGSVSFETKIENKPKPRLVDIYTKDRINDLCNLFDTTPWGLCCAIESVGSDPRAIGRFLRNHNATRERSAVAID
jgi:hypothetical protein